MIPTTSSIDLPPTRRHQPTSTELKIKSKQSEPIPVDEDFEQWLDELAVGLPKMPSLPKDFSRADIYVDDEQ
jgi:hypothetical protein